MSLVCVAVLLAQAAGGSSAEAAPQHEGLVRALVEEALAKNPAVAEAQAAIRVARARSPQAAAYPPPVLSVGYTNDGWAPSLGSQPMTTLAFTGSQSLPYPGTRGLRRDIADSQADDAETRLARVRRSLTASVGRAFAGLVEVRELTAVLNEQLEVLRDIEGVARARYVSGQGGQQDVLRAQVELTRMEQRLVERAGEETARLAELNQLLDRPAGSPLATAGECLMLRSLTEPLGQAIERLSAENPELHSARLAIRREESTAALASKALKPELTVQAGYMNRGGLDPMWQAGVGVAIPFGKGRHEGALAEGRARRDGAARRAESLALALRFRTEERYAQTRTLERSANLIENGIIPQGRLAVEAALASYRVGRAPFLSVLEALVTLASDQASLVRTIAAHARARASLEEASLESAEAGSPGASAASPMSVGGASTTTMGRM
jgi:outer membrane protein TolC